MFFAVLQVRRHTANHTGNVLFSMNYDTLCWHEPTVQPAGISNTDKTVLCNRSDQKAHLIHMGI